MTAWVAATPVSALGFSPDAWQYSEKAQLIERLNKTRDNLDRLIEGTRSEGDFGVANKLQQARMVIGIALHKVRNAEAHNWREVVEALETQLSAYDFYDYGVWDGNFWDPVV